MVSVLSARCDTYLHTHACAAHSAWDSAGSARLDHHLFSPYTQYTLGIFISRQTTQSSMVADGRKPLVPISVPPLTSYVAKAVSFILSRSPYEKGKQVTRHITQRATYTSIPRTMWWKKRPDSSKLFPNLYMCAMIPKCVHTHVYTHILNNDVCAQTFLKE